MGFGFVVERFGLFLQMVAHESLAGPQRGFSLALGVLLLVLGAVVALVSARQFRQVAKALDPVVVPPGYWTHVGVGLNVVIAVIARSIRPAFCVAGPIAACELIGGFPPRPRSISEAWSTPSVLCRYKLHAN